MNGSIPADAMEIGHRRADSGCGGRGSWRCRVRVNRGRARCVNSTAVPVPSACTSKFGGRQRNRTAQCAGVGPQALASAPMYG